MKNLLVIIFLSLATLKGQAQNWTLLNDYFQVYTFSDKVMGLTIELGYTTTYQNLIVDLIFEKCSVTDSLSFIISQQVKSSLPVDTNGKFRFFRNINLEDNLLNGIDKTFFVYCTKGIVQRTIKDVVFSLDECKSNIIVFRFDKIDTTRFGHPILCMRRKLPVQFGSFATVSKEIEVAEQNNKGDYSDSVKSVVFAKMDSLYFVFKDSFNWNDLMQHKNSSLSPARFIFVKGQDGNLNSKWNSGLDILGIPCD